MWTSWRSSSTCNHVHRTLIFKMSGLKFHQCFVPRTLCKCLHVFHANRACQSGIQKWNEELTPDVKHSIENFWCDKLKQVKYEENSQKPKYYVLSMFPYPSGKLHMGHVRVYTISDTMARFHQMNNKNVIHPMGWDAFGLPAENAAIDHGVRPREWTTQNINHMREQLMKLGCSFDWAREICTCDPSYYRWTQALFLRLYTAGLVFRKKALVNWDPVDQTVLADEQVDENGCSWRSGARVEKKLLNQWFIKTTHFSKSLYDGLNDPLLGNWWDIVKLQKHWIGKCNGFNIDFKIEGLQTPQTLTVWTDMPESVFEASFIAVSPGSVLDRLEPSDKGQICRKLTVTVKNPFVKTILPVYVTDQVVYSDGADTHLGVPTFSQTDRLFAESVGIPVTSSSFASKDEISKARERVHTLCQQKRISCYPCSSKLRDWLVSRQRYWGTPIPLVHCSSCGSPQPVPYKDLPVELPDIQHVSSRGTSALKDAADWLHTKCPKCGGDATRETDTMDTFFDSSWYFLRYLDPHNLQEPFCKDLAFKMMPVDLYIGGKEHAVLHLYYARFMNHFLHSEGMVPHREPFKQLLVQGMIKGRSYRVKGTNHYLPSDQVDFSDKKPVEKHSRQPLVVTWEKMSKSKQNGVDPEDILKQHGIDATRLLILADVAPTSHRHWSTDTFPGILNWQRRLWLTVGNFLHVRSHMVAENARGLRDSPEFEKEEEIMFDSRNYYVKGVNFNYQISFQLSVAISKMQGLTNSLRKATPAVVGGSLQFERALACQIIMLAPMAPHFASELWSGFISAPYHLNQSGEVQWDKGVLQQSWPQVDPTYQLELVFKVNGHDVCSVKIPKSDFGSLSHSRALELAVTQTRLQEYTLGYDTAFTLHPDFEAQLHFTTRKATNLSSDQE